MQDISSVPEVYLQYSSTLVKQNVLQYIFSWTSEQLNCIRYNISCFNVADFKYTSLVYQKYHCRVFLIKPINMHMYV